MGANLALKLAAEAADRPLEGLDCVVAANPPLDLDACCRAIQQPANRIYDRNFVRNPRVDVTRLHRAFPNLGPGDLRRARSLYEFDEIYTAPRNGFADVADNYARSSAGPILHRIQVPGLVILAEDDPIIPPGSFRDLAFPPGLALELIRNGGHLGYLSRTTWQGDRRWLEARISAWLAAHWTLVHRRRPASTR